jgi:hypothetical protein
MHHLRSCSRGRCVGFAASKPKVAFPALLHPGHVSEAPGLCCPLSIQGPLSIHCLTLGGLAWVEPLQRLLPRVLRSSVLSASLQHGQV